MEYLVQADTGVQMRVTLTRHDTGNPLILTDDTVLLKVRKKGTTNVLFTITGIEFTAGDYLIGLVTFLFGSNLDTLIGYYEAEVEVTYGTTEVESVYELIGFQIRPDF